MFARDIHPAVGPGKNAEHRAHVNNAAVTMLAHRWQNSLSDTQHSEKVRLEQPTRFGATKIPHRSKHACSALGQQLSYLSADAGGNAGDQHDVVFNHEFLILTVSISGGHRRQI